MEGLGKTMKGFSEDNRCPENIRTENLPNTIAERHRVDHSLPTSACDVVGPECAMLLWLISVDRSLFSEQEN
jgi:hypothetical protein